MPYLICINCGVRFVGSNDGSITKKKILCGECFNELHGLHRSQF